MRGKQYLDFANQDRRKKPVYIYILKREKERVKNKVGGGEGGRGGGGRRT